MVCRYFNEILSLAEKIGGRVDDTTWMLDFQDFIQSAGLIDAGFEENPYT